MPPPSVWLCPISPANARASLETPMWIGTHYVYAWAMNARRTYSYAQLQPGDLCIFGSHRSPDIYLARVQHKRPLSPCAQDDPWPYPSPSGTPWRFVFTLEQPVRLRGCGLDEMHECYALRRKGSIQTQTRVPDSAHEKIMHTLWKHIKAKKSPPFPQ